MDQNDHRTPPEGPESEPGGTDSAAPEQPGPTAPQEPDSGQTGAGSPPPSEPGPSATADDEKDTNTWAMVLHLSILAGLVVPFAGLVAPIVIYLVKKDTMPGLEPHAHVVFNWIISAVIYAIVAFILMFVVIGVFVMFALAIVSIVFPIIGGVKASEGKVWPYPLSIPIFK